MLNIQLETLRKPQRKHYSSIEIFSGISQSLLWPGFMLS